MVGEGVVPERREIYSWTMAIGNRISFWSQSLTSWRPLGSYFFNNY